jgi:hypothetical protein
MPRARALAALVLFTVVARPAGAQASAGAAPLESRAANAPDQRPAFAGQTRAPAAASSAALDVTVVARGLERPWAVEPLPGGDLLVTEKPGRLRVVSASGALGAPRRRRPPGRRARPGRPARRGAEPDLRPRPHPLLELQRAARGRQRDERRPRRALGRPHAARLGARDPPRPARLRRRSALRLAPRVRRRRDALRHARRPLRHADAPARAAARQPHGEDPPRAPRRHRAERQPVRRPRGARSPRSGRSATATCRRPPWTPRGGCGRSSTARAAATS